MSVERFIAEAEELLAEGLLVYEEDRFRKSIIRLSNYVAPLAQGADSDPAANLLLTLEQAKSDLSKFASWMRKTKRA